MKSKLFFLVGSIALIAILMLSLSPSPSLTTITIGSQTFPVEIAKTAKQHERGLSGRTSLEQNHGMLFVFDQPTVPKFWMKDMRFAIDILWLDENYKILGIERNITPDTYPKTFEPPVAVQYVLETNPGLISF